MKKIAIAVMIFAAFMVLPNVQADNAKPSDQTTVKAPKSSFVKAFNYFWASRVLDLADIFSVEVSTGPQVGAALRATRLLGVGGNVGASGAVVKNCNRQYGWALDKGWEAQIAGLQFEDMERTFAGGSVKNYWAFDPSLKPSQMEELYALNSGARDYWAIEGSASLFLGAKVALHPVQIFDLIVGFFGFDPAGDDLDPAAE